jgi:patatin-like phospholipase/acyl hydrolase
MQTEAPVLRILSIDGGGIRGLIPAVILAEIEERTGRRIAELFDFIAGTSTGGIIALMLARPSWNGRYLSARDVVSLYQDHGHQIFSRTLWHALVSLDGLVDEKYPADGLEEQLGGRLGDMRLSHATVDVLVTAYDIERRSPFFFKSRSARQSPRRDFLMRDVARATTAAPTYFEPAQITDVGGQDRYALVDGGVFANNPGMCALAEVRSLYPEARDVMLVSLGTGEATRPILYKDARDWGAVKWVKPVLNVIVDGAGETVDYQLGRMLSPVGGQRRYFRVQGLLDPSTEETADTSAVHLANLRRLAQGLAQGNEVGAICGALGSLPRLDPSWPRVSERSPL